MSQIEIRHAVAEDAHLVTNFIKKMVIEMENLGGYIVSRSPKIWNLMESDIRLNCTRQDYIYLLASKSSFNSKIAGMAAGNIEQLESIFVSKKRLHISAIYTVPPFRRQGVAKFLLQYLIDWGQQMNVDEVDLNVLVLNPACRLYEKFGFEPQEIAMIKKLESFGY